jgi:hypothetical protein
MMKKRGETVFCTLVLRKRTVVKGSLAHLPDGWGVGEDYFTPYWWGREMKGGVVAFWPQLSPDNRISYSHKLYISAPSEELGSTYQLVQDLRTMVTQRQVSVLPRWLKEAQECGIPELKSFVAGIYRDYDAVRAALATEQSNGQTEGKVNKRFAQEPRCMLYFIEALW